MKKPNLTVRMVEVFKNNEKFMADIHEQNLIVEIQDFLAFDEEPETNDFWNDFDIEDKEYIRYEKKAWAEWGKQFK